MSEKNTEMEELIKKQVKKQLKEKLGELNTPKSEYNGWLVCNSICKRSLAVIGHYTVGYLSIIIPILLVIFLFVLIG